MSDFSKQIQCMRLYQKFIEYKPLNLKVSNSVIQDTLYGSTYERWRISATLGTTVSLPEFTNSTDRELVFDSVKRKLVDALFEEFRKPIRDIEISLLSERNVESALDLLQKLRVQMFE